MKRMLDINKYVAKFLLYSIPVILIVAIWGSIQTQEEVLAMNNSLIYIIWNIITWYFIIWIVCAIYFFSALAFSRKFREVILLKLAKIKERDERETHIVGNACKATFLSTMALSLLLLFFSVLQVSIVRLSPEEAVAGKTGQLTIGLRLSLFDTAAGEQEKATEELWVMRNPLSKEGILMLIIIWQIISFHYFSRKNNH
jgi:hypothetical protein